MIFRQSCVQPVLDFQRKETKDQVHGAAYKLQRCIAQTCGSLRLPPEIVLETHVVRERQGRVVDLQEVRNEVLFAVDHGSYPL